MNDAATKRKKRIVLIRRTIALLVALSLTGGIYYSRYSSPLEVVAATETRIFSANATWTAPAGVTSVTAEAWAGGGGGGGTGASGNGGGGGAGGGYAKTNNISVTSGNDYTVVVGQGGPGGNGTNNGSTGGNSMFLASTTLLAIGGTGGASLANGSAGGATTTGAVGDTIFHGGNGGNGTGTSGGGGGGAGDAANGTRAVNNTAGTGGSADGGNGGAGVSGNQAGNPGNSLAGGGSGADSNNSTNRTGGAGAIGQVRLTYTVYTILADATDPANATLEPGDPATFAGAFSFQTSTSTDIITAAVVGLGTGAHNGISLVEITNSAGTTVYGSVSNPASATPSITLNTNTLTATTSATVYKIRITPKAEVTGGPYTVTAKIDSFTGTNTQQGSDVAGTTITINNTSVPGAPGTPTFSSVAATTLTVSWTAASGATSYKLERCAGVGCSDFAEIATGIAGTSYDDSGLTGNTTYRYRVRGTNVAGDGSYSGTGTQLMLPGTPGTPTFSNVDVTTLTLSWTAPTGGAASYKIERCTGAGCSDFSQIASGETGTSYNDTGLSGSTLYRYRVRATNATGDGAYSGTGETTTSTPPASSANYIRLNGGTRLNGGVRLR